MRNIYLVRNKLQRHYLRLIAIAIILPTLILGGCLYYVIFYLMAEQLGIPEVVAYNLLPVVKKVNMALAISLPVIFIALLSLGIYLTRKLVGPIERLEAELERQVSEKRHSPLKIRKDDTLKPLIDSINNLLGSLSNSN